MRKQEKEIDSFFSGASAEETMDNLYGEHKKLTVVPKNLETQSKEIDAKNEIPWKQTITKETKGKVVEIPMPTIDNLEILMGHFNVFVDYDEILLRSSVRGIKSLPGNEANTLIAYMKNKCVEHGLNKSVVDDQLDTISEKYVINPVSYWLNHTKRTSQANPVKELVDLLPVDNKEWVEIALDRWLIQCCAAADMGRNSPNEVAISKYESVLVFCGKQGYKKSSFIKYLIPKSLHKYTKEGILLDVKDKDSMLKTLCCWIPELGELDSTFRRSDISALKAFLSNTEDIIRLPFARKPIAIKRHISCFATVNEEKYLRDLTGNRRYLPVNVIGSLDVMAKNKFDVNDLWAYAWERYINGEQWWLTDEEEKIQNNSLQKHEDNTIEESLLDLFNFESSREVRMTTSEVLYKLSLKDTHTNKIKIGKSLKKLSVKKVKRQYLMPPIRDVYNKF
ncbi:putative DNA primase/helicase [Bathymodiolus japonicus methanotrophic gill symbiont]|uniref:virulence-associated E family protein n=1 Tax=Bathymodiolus japonicus methanotrophic gill symbiont TaxID=113269 RepID=UPI001B69AAAF|nr:virulence-associated E family protein [Bathymodiolus japonicus methanotrophic gill symbiont]GFO72860.1 putative DNA primase/helicase [Bathymodiolus japonicus methanotrophic gill symbiont]